MLTGDNTCNGRGGYKCSLCWFFTFLLVQKSNKKRPPQMIFSTFAGFSLMKLLCWWLFNSCTLMPGTTSLMECKRLTLQVMPKSIGMQKAAHQHFRFGVFGFDGGHVILLQIVAAITAKTFRGFNGRFPVVAGNDERCLVLIDSRKLLAFSC